MKVNIIIIGLALCCFARCVHAQVPYLVKDINPGINNTSQRFLTAVDTNLLFVANDGVNGWQLWKSDGTEAGTNLVKIVNTDGWSMNNPKGIGKILYFNTSVSDKGRLWKSDGTDTGTVMLKEINTNSFTSVNNWLFFSGGYGTPSGGELWKSDGTEAGTIMVKDIWKGNNSSNPSNLINVNGTLFFTAVDSLHGRELWKSDGTDAGTVMVKELNPDPYYPNSIFFLFIPLSDQLLFFASDGAQVSLWKSDGTAKGTIILKKLYMNFDERYLERYSEVINNTAYFSAKNENGTGLWKSDGTESGTVLVKQMDLAQYFKKINNTLYFIAPGISGDHLWKSDGTEGGTVMVTNLYPNYTTSISELIVVDTTLFITAQSSNMNTRELWKSDGTAAGTIKIDSGNFKNPMNLVATPNALFFNAYSDSTGWEVWTLKVKTQENPVLPQNDNTITISPNPFDGSATITINADISDGAEFVLYDMLGKEVRRFEVSTLSFAIKRGELSDGVYTLQWLNGNNTISQRLVIMR